MDRTLVIGDLHIGARNNSEVFLNFMEKFFNEELFPYILKNNVTTVIQLGDTLDKRKSIDFTVSDFLIKNWLMWFNSHKVQLYSIVGNHDTYYKNTNEISGIKQYEGLFRNCEPNYVHIVDTPTMIKPNFHLIPWICPDNIDMVTEYLKKIPDDSIIFGHFELAGFDIGNGFESKANFFDKSLLNRFTYVFSGHYHKSQQKGNIEYIGSPYPLTWNDYADIKKIVSFDTNDIFGTREDIPTKSGLFHKIIFDSENQEIPDIPEHSYIKIIVNKPSELLDLYVNNLIKKINPADCQIIDMTAQDTIDESLIDVSELDTPFNILMKSISSIQDDYVSKELLAIYNLAEKMEAHDNF